MRQVKVSEPVPSATNLASTAEYFARALLAGSDGADRQSENRPPTSQPSTPEAIKSAEYLRWLTSICGSRSIVCQRIATDRASDHTRHGESPPVFSVLEGDWDPAKHPRRGGPPNAGWFATNGGGSVGRSGDSGTATKRSTLNRILDRNRELSNLAGSRSSATIRAANLAAELQSAPRLPREMATAFASGLKTGGKAVINGGATSIKNVATLGLSSSQLELLGVTDEDRARGYDTAVTIGTGSGELLISVGTGGISSALSKGGSVARGAGGALVAYDSAGNAVGVVQGSYDAANEGVSIRNGAQITAGALGLSANVRAVRSSPSGTPTKLAPPVRDSELTSPIRGGRYGHLEDPASANSGKGFTATQRKAILAENQRQNGGELRDDRTGETLVPPQRREQGVTLPPNEAQIDHVYPKSKGGPNTYSNAEVRARHNNQRKGNKIE